MLPAMFAKRGTYGISGAAVIASGTGVAFLGLLGFEAIVEILNLLCEFVFMAGFVRLFEAYPKHLKPFGIKRRICFWTRLPSSILFAPSVFS